MALGSRSRNNKRTSSNSYASTITTVVFIALCVLGIWMLSPNLVAPPQTTSRSTTSTTSTSSDSTFFSSHEQPHLIKPKDKERPPPFEDNPGDLPDDAIKSDDQNSNSDEDHPKTTAKEVEKQESSVAEQASESEENQESIVEESRRNKQSEGKDSKDQEQISGSDSNETSKESENDKSVEDQEQNRNRDQEESNTHRNSERQISDGEDIHQQLKNSISQENSREFQNNILEQKELENSDWSNNDDESSNQNKTSERSHLVLRPQRSQTPSEEKEQQSQHVSTTEDSSGESNSGGSLENSGIPKESKESKKAWSTQAAQSEVEKDRRKDESDGNESIYGYTWRLCNVTAGADYIPCLDNEKALRQLHTTGHFEHRERHCPEEGPTCLVPFPDGYRRPIGWPKSRDKIWYHNVPHRKLAEVKGHQNWVKVTGEFLTFPGGGTQFIHGALHYIDFLQQAEPKIAWGKHTRVILDVGCGVASFGGYLFERDVLAMSFAPKDEHEAQVQFALERGIPAISAVMGSQRLPFPSSVFDLVHCARCRVPWHAEGGLLLLELNRVLRPGGFFVWSATPVYQKLKEDVEIWKAMSSLTVSMCWELVTIKKDKLNSIGAAIYRKPTSNECYDQRKQKRPPMCKADDDPNAAWYVPLQTCMHRVPIDKAERGTEWPVNWPRRLQTPPQWLNSSQMGIYGKPAPQDFATDYEHWKRVVNKTYLNGLGISLSNVRNVMDMRSVYGGFAAALKDLPVWVMNVVNVDSPDTLPIIYERGLFGIYHDWCESFSTYPRTYDLLHADHLFSILKKRCKLAPVMAEVDRIVRPGGKLIVRDESSAIGEVENLLKSLHWEVHLTFSKNQEGLLSAQKGDWRPETYADSS